MRGARHIDSYIGAALYMDMLCRMLDGPPSIWRLVLPLRVHLLNVNVLHVRADVGEAPGNVLVVPGHDERHSGQRHTCDIKSASFQMGLVPRVRNGVPEMHIVREHRLSVGRVSAGNHPVIRPRNALATTL